MEVETAIARTSRSPMIRDAHDFRAGIHDRQLRKLTGRSYSALVHPVARDFPLDEMQEGDVFFHNDVYESEGGIGHLPDLCVTVPVFHQGVVAFVQAFGHHDDIGGACPGSMPSGRRASSRRGCPFRRSSCGTRSSQQGGAADHDPQLAHARQPRRRPRRRVLGLPHGRAGSPSCSSATDATPWRPPSTRSSTRPPRRTAVRSSPRSPTAPTSGRTTRSTTASTTRAAHPAHHADQAVHRWPRSRRWRSAAGHRLHRHRPAGQGPDQPLRRLRRRHFLKKWLAPILRNLADTPERMAELDVNEGIVPLIEMKFPEKGTLLTPIFPAPTNARTFVILRLLGVLAGVVAKAVDGKMPADQETIRYTGVYGKDRDGNDYLMREVLGGGSGGRYYADGEDTIHVVPDSRNLPTEFTESRFPFIVERLGLAVDSGGAGRYRGGLGYEKQIRMLKDANFMSIADRSILACWGVKGGRPGGRSRSPSTSAGRRSATSTPSPTTSPSRPARSSGSAPPAAAAGATPSSAPTTRSSATCAGARSPSRAPGATTASWPRHQGRAGRRRRGLGRAAWADARRAHRGAVLRPRPWLRPARRGQDGSRRRLALSSHSEWQRDQRPRGTRAGDGRVRKTGRAVTAALVARGQPVRAAVRSETGAKTAMPPAPARSRTSTSRPGSVSQRRSQGAGPSTTSRPTSTRTRWASPPGSWPRPAPRASGASCSTRCCTPTTTPCRTTSARPPPRRSPGARLDHALGRRPTTRTSPRRPTKAGLPCPTASTPLHERRPPRRRRGRRPRPASRRHRARGADVRPLRRRDPHRHADGAHRRLGARSRGDR